MAMMVAEELGVEFERVRPTVGDTSAMGFNFLTAAAAAPSPAAWPASSPRGR